MNETGAATNAVANVGLLHPRSAVSNDRLAIILFDSEAAAGCNVAGLPAAARALHEVAEAGMRRCAIAVPGGWSPGSDVVEELDRLAGGAAYICVDSQAPAAFGGEAVLLVAGEQLVRSDDIRRAVKHHATLHPGLAFAPFAARDARARLATAHGIARLRQVGERILVGTSKPGDGIVSRHINRPISQAISRLLLRYPAMRPIHATYATAVIAVAMTACLLLGGYAGLMAGAALFQAASIVDGVDGEIARATFRTSARGAMLDSLIDAATNVAFVLGVTVNLYLQGDSAAAMAGGFAAALLGVGLTLIGRAARSSKRPFTFNGVKERVGASNSHVMTWLTWLTMRDFFALAASVLIILGFAPLVMFAFAVVTVGWLAVVITVLLRRPA